MFACWGSCGFRVFIKSQGSRQHLLLFRVLACQGHVGMSLMKKKRFLTGKIHRMDGKWYSNATDGIVWYRTLYVLFWRLRWKRYHV